MAMSDLANASPARRESLNDRDVLGNTPLHWLLINGHLKAARYFIAHYAKYGLD